MYVCMHVCMCRYVYVNAYAHIHLSTHSNDYVARDHDFFPCEAI